MLRMKLLSLNKFFLTVLCFLIIPLSLKSEDTVDIWKNNKNIEKDLTINNEIKEQENQINISKKKRDSNIKISENFESTQKERDLYGVYDPEDLDLSLGMWLKSDGKEIKKTFQRIEKLKLSKSAEEIFEKIIMTYSYLPEKNINKEEFLKLKFNWLIENEKDILIKEFLNKNENFEYKKELIQYLVDRNIAKANLKEGCKSANFISKEIKDPYLEKFKIYCLIYNNKKNEAQLIFDLLKEQKLSDNFFENKINFLLGVELKRDNKIKDDNLLNFYLSSITVENFNYEPNKKTNKFIWEYLDAANLIQIEDVEDKGRIKNLEIAANENTFDKEKIFEIYKKFLFDINTLVNAEDIYTSLDTLNARALIYQKYILSDKDEKKIENLILLKELFKKDNLSNVYRKFLSDRLNEIKIDDNISDSYVKLIKRNTISDEEYKLGKIKYNDKILHKSRVIKYFTEKNFSKEKTQKNLNNIYKKIRRNKNYFFSAKDLLLVQSLEKDGFKIPKEIKHKSLSKKYNIPETLSSLLKRGEVGLLCLKFVEIIGEDEIYNLDPETIYFITNLLNEADLIKFRNTVINSSLPSRV